MENRKEHISLEGKTVLVTGSPGFIGAALAERLLSEAECSRVISLDNMNSYYSPALKEHRLECLEKASALSGAPHMFIKGSVADKSLVDTVFREFRPDIVVNLAAQAGVRWSASHPEDYIESNITGFFNILEACRKYPVMHLIYASSSSVYGENSKMPFSTQDMTDSPVSLYAATKKSNELMAHAYSKLYDIPATGLRFFTVYGPAGRPDMFYYSASRLLAEGKSIKLFNGGDMARDFTYVDDIVEGILRVMQGAPERKTGASGLPEARHAVYNIGRGRPERLAEFVKTLHGELVRTGVLPAGHSLAEHTELAPMQPGDVANTFADTVPLERDYGFRPSAGIREGLGKFAEWYAAHPEFRHLAAG